MFFYIFTIAISQASQIITGHLVGAKKFDEVKRKAYRNYLYALSITISICIAGAIFGEKLMGIFTADEVVITLGAQVLFINIFLELGRTTNLVIIGCLRGAGDVYFPTICAVFSMMLVSTLGSYIFAVVLGWGIYGLWIAIAADEVIRGILMLFRWRSEKWKTKGINK